MDYLLCLIMLIVVLIIGIPIIFIGILMIVANIYESKDEIDKDEWKGIQ